MANQAHGLVNGYAYQGQHRRDDTCLQKLVWSDRYRGQFWLKFQIRTAVS